jgi:hypothetical protein
MVAVLSVLILFAGCGDDDGTVDAADVGDTGVDAPDSGSSDARADTGPGFTCPEAIVPIPARTSPSPLGPMDDVLRLDHLQVKGTHNSYHVAPPEHAIPDWEYTHVPLDEQLESQGVRAVELDVNWNARCRRYEVYHVGLLDEVTTCFLLSECLGVMRAWSDENPGHVPILVQIEVKDFPDETTAERLDALDAEIRAIWPDEMRISPDDVRGTHASVREGIVTDGWPTLAEVRGKALFFLNDGGDTRDAYTSDRTTLAGRVMFAEAGAGEPVESVLVLNSPDDPRVATAVPAGFLVRTRADSGGVEARANDTTRRDAALASGAHIVSTDFPAPVEGLDYWVEIPGGMPARCNPVSAPSECTAEAVALAR